MDRPPRLLLLVLVLSALGACQCVRLDPGARFACDPDGNCPAGQRCALAGEAEAGFCVSVGDDGGTGGDGGVLNDGGLLNDGGTPSGIADLVFDNASGAGLNDFPVLIALDPSKIDYAAVVQPATDLRFFDPDTSQNLPFQIDTWAPGGESLVWVLVPNIGAGRSDDRITLYWGPGAGGQEDPTGFSVFGASAAVWHMGGGLLPNSARAQYFGTPNSGVLVDTGRVGAARRFTGTGDQHVGIDGGEALFDGWGAFCLELWIRPDYASFSSITTEGTVLDKGGPVNLGRVFKTGTGTSQALKLQIDMHFVASPNDTYLGAEVPLGTWTWVVYSFDGLALVVYANGQEVGRTDFLNSTTLNSGTELFHLGGYVNPINGAIDEVRIARVARSADWVRAQYRSMTRQFVSFRAR